MNISRNEQRVLHVLAQGGLIRFTRNGAGKVTEIDCFNREGLRLADCSLSVFERLRKRRLIRSRSGGPYRITREGLLAVRAQLDNR
ncbi:MAG: YjhX family toxin [Erythrobacter sp.]|nr:YjhX family toxin [Erythrobacter sp.]